MGLYTLSKRPKRVDYQQLFTTKRGRGEKKKKKRSQRTRSDLHLVQKVDNRLAFFILTASQTFCPMCIRFFRQNVLGSQHVGKGHDPPPDRRWW